MTEQPVFLRMGDVVEANGKTIRENNMEIVHSYAVGDLVEVKYDKWHEDGACEVVHARLWIVSCIRDCDGTPLYSLSPTPRHKWVHAEILFDWGCDIGIRPTKQDIADNMLNHVVIGLPEKDLTKIEITEDIKRGVGALKVE